MTDEELRRAVRENIKRSAQEILQSALDGNEQDIAFATSVQVALSSWLQGNAVYHMEVCRMAIARQRCVSLEQLEPSMN